MRTCFKPGRLIYLVTVLFTLAGMLGCASVQTPTAPSPQAGAQTEKPAPQPQRANYPGPIMAPYFPPPEKIDLCGEPVPLDYQEVQERFDKEFTLVVYNHAQVYLWLKRMERYFPWIEERLRYYNLPDDLKYVAIAESDLLPNACSPKGAAGPWQFMPSTGSAYGLEQRKSVDKRYDMERSTESAFLYLQDLNRKYKSWSLAIASYNCGEKRILDESRSQGIKDYYHMKLPLETERYVFRILAIKAVLSDPARYGYDMPKGAGYPQLRVDKVSVTMTAPVSIQTAAANAGITFREFKRLNPAFRGDDIPAGTHEINLPAGSGREFEQRFKAGGTRTSYADTSGVQRDEQQSSDQSQDEESETAAAQPQPASPKPQAVQPKPGKGTALKSRSAPAAAKFHTVKKGDTLSSVARRYDVSVSAIKQANKLKSDSLAPGQKIRIP
jgi:membrane-bound lytic murein transglycosylase D